jgi:hypothetical protein
MPAATPYNSRLPCSHHFQHSRRSPRPSSPASSAPSCSLHPQRVAIATPSPSPTSAFPLWLRQRVQTHSSYVFGYSAQAQVSPAAVYCRSSAIHHYVCSHRHWFALTVASLCFSGHYKQNAHTYGRRSSLQCRRKAAQQQRKRETSASAPAAALAAPQAFPSRFTTRLPLFRCAMQAVEGVPASPTTLSSSR